MIDFVLQQVGAALARAAAMGWTILWPLVLGFALSAVIQAVVRRERIAQSLAHDSPRSLTVATVLGAAASSCSYAAVALARALFRRGSSLTNAIAFEIASTNLVFELGIVLALSLGWRFTLAEFIAGPIMIVVLALLFRIWLRRSVVERARSQADQGLAGSMEGHAAMDMSVAAQGGFLRRLLSPAGLTSTSQYFVMDWVAVLRDIVLGLLIAGAFDAWVPRSWLQAVFLTHDPSAAAAVGPLIGPLIAVISFVCSVGNVPLAAVLWNGGISFGGVISFLFADLIIVPILQIYRRYYGWRAAGIIAGTLYLAMVVAGYAVEGLFALLRILPTDRRATILESGIGWDYTTWLNIVLLVVAAALVARFFASGSGSMLRMMNGGPDAHHAHESHGHTDAVGNQHTHTHEHEHEHEHRDRHLSNPGPIHHEAGELLSGEDHTLVHEQRKRPERASRGQFHDHDHTHSGHTHQSLDDSDGR